MLIRVRRLRTLSPTGPLQINDKNPKASDAEPAEDAAGARQAVRTRRRNRMARAGVTTGRSIGRASGINNAEAGVLTTPSLLVSLRCLSRKAQVDGCRAGCGPERPVPEMAPSTDT